MLLKILRCLLFSVVASSPAPYSKVDPTTLGFQSLARGGDAAPTSLWGEFQGPLPTNSWWENIVLAGGITASNNVFQSPYILTASTTQVRAFYPRILVVGNQVQDIFDDVNGFVGLTSAEAPTRTIKSFDDLSVTLQFGTAGKSMESPLVRGSPFISATYSGLTPKIVAPVAIFKMRVDGGNTTDPCKPGTTVTGQKFELDFLVTDSTWNIYASEPITFTCGSTTETSLTATEVSKSTTLQIALSNNCTFGNSLHCDLPKTPSNSSAYSALLDAHAGTAVVGGDVSWSVQRQGKLNGEGDTAKLQFQWRTQQLFEANPFSASSSSSALMCALPHHVQSFDTTTTAGLASADIGHRNLRGWNRLVAGDSWTATLTLPPISFQGNRPVPAERKQDILDALLNRGNSSDSNYNPPLNYQLGVGDTYFSAKMYAKQGRIALIADELGHPEVASAVAGRLGQYLQSWLNGTSGTTMLYDKSWGGFLSCGCQYDNCQGKCTPHCDNTFPSCPALSDPGMNFGNGYYNDHHFHYGYFLHAFAVVSKFDPSFLSKHKEQILLYARDFANPSNSDPFFPKFRHKDFYFGGSWAGGIPLAAGQAYYNGRNQESTSEAVNAYYGLSLLGLVLNNDAMLDIGRVLLATEIKAAQTYWHIPDSSDIYPEEIKPNKMVGILWSNLAQYQTWFGNQPYLVHGIQLLPVTPISESLMPKAFVQEQYPVFEKVCKGVGGCANTGWETMMVLDQAIVDSSAAWDAVKALPDYVFSSDDAAGNGNSRVGALHWVATRPS